MKNLVFVYGSLKRGNWNNCYLEDANYIGKAVTVDRFLMTNVGFPYMIPEEEVTKELPTLPVVGEVYLIEDELTQKKLDNLEGISSQHYRHKEIFVSVDGEVLRVTAYVPCDPSTQNYPIASINEEGCYDF